MEMQNLINCMNLFKFIDEFMKELFRTTHFL